MTANLPFSASIKPGEPVADQVVYAVRRALVSGQLRAGDPFPSVRTLGQELRVNPNTAHRIVSALVDEGVLVVRAGIGTFVAGPAAASRERRAALEDDVERLVVEAKGAGLTLQQTVALLRDHWSRTSRKAG